MNVKSLVLAVSLLSLPAFCMKTEEIIEKKDVETSHRYTPEQLKKVCLLGAFYFLNEEEIPAGYDIISDLNECADKGCFLSRLTKTGLTLRNQFESKIINCIRSNISPFKQVVYTSCSSGLLLQDLIILNRLIDPKSTFSDHRVNLTYKDMHINLIDPLYFENFEGKSPYRVPIFLRGAEEKKLRVRSPERAVKQFATFLASLPGTHISITLYKNMKDYLRDIEQKTGKKTDIFTLVDWEKEYFSKTLIEEAFNNPCVFGILADTTPHIDVWKNKG